MIIADMSDTHRINSESLNSPDTRALTDRYLTLRSRFLRTLGEHSSVPS